jgi:hypothetical protein
MGERAVLCLRMSAPVHLLRAIVLLPLPGACCMHGCTLSLLQATCVPQHACGVSGQLVSRDMLPDCWLLLLLKPLLLRAGSRQRARGCWC